MTLSRILAVFCALAAFTMPVRAEMTLVAFADYPPFADPDWPAQGIATEIITAALKDNPDPLPFGITWETDRREAIRKVGASQIDMGFPWAHPSCDEAGVYHKSCDQFRFSDPIAETVVLLFTRVDGQFDFARDEDVQGRVLCRPTGFYTHDLERPGRRWLSRELVRLRQPEKLEDCFELLMQGTVDAVAVNEFLGVRALFQLELTEVVVPLPRPLSEQTLHVAVSRSHWRATAHLYRLNAGLARLRETGQYAEILDRQLGLYWDEIKR